MKKLLVPIIAVVLVAGGVFAYFTFFKKTEKAEKKAIYFTYKIEDSFLTNVKSSQSLFKTSISFEVEEKEKEKEKQVAFLEENLSVIRDTVLFLFREKTYEELRSSNIREVLSLEIVHALGQKLNVDYIKSVYFNEYVVQ